MFSIFRRRTQPSPTGKPFAPPRGAHVPWQAERLNELDVLPRALVHGFPKQAFADWARKQGADHDLAGLRHTDSLAYLIPTVTWETGETEEFIEHHWQQKRTFQMFNQWFEVRTSEMVLDLGGYAD